MYQYLLNNISPKCLADITSLMTQPQFLDLSPIFNLLGYLTQSLGLKHHLLTDIS